ncbi:hypothetical protein CC117_00895 [Parafrankia colletiae]|uniref:Transposase n=1 Tax=Parafrankia colletiae TaxID=573497 RepID=A0A1S1RKD2_9ACTN|nr:hypothetical protein CC117_00895 [Parafrankia colletiae]
MPCLPARRRGIETATPGTGESHAPLNDAPEEGLGRSRGGFTTKIHRSADGHRRPVSLLITAGQVADTTRFTAIKANRRRRDRRGGRPSSFDAEAYKRRNTVE